MTTTSDETQAEADARLLKGLQALSRQRRERAARARAQAEVDRLTIYAMIREGRRRRGVGPGQLHDAIGLTRQQIGRDFERPLHRLIAGARRAGVPEHRIASILLFSPPMSDADARLRLDAVRASSLSLEAQHPEESARLEMVPPPPGPGGRPAAYLEPTT